MSITYLSLKLLPELKRLVDLEARKQHPPVPSNEWVVREIARILGCPELGVVPRKVTGRIPRHLIPS